MPVLVARGQEGEQDRHADAVIQPAFYIQPLADIARYGLVCHHSLAQCRIGGGQHGRNQCDFQQGQPVEQQVAGHELEQDRQRQADQQKFLGNLEGVFEFTEIRVGSIRKKDQGEGQFGEGAQELYVYFQRQEPQPQRAEGQAKGGENDRAVKRGFFEAPA